MPFHDDFITIATPLVLFMMGGLLACRCWYFNVFLCLYSLFYIVFL